MLLMLNTRSITMLINKYILIIFFVSYISYTKANDLAGKSIRTHPCNGTDSIVEVFEKSELPDDNNRFYLFIDLSKYKNGKGIPVHSKIHLKFDSEADIKVDTKYGIVLSSAELTYSIDIIKEKKGWIKIVVRGSWNKPLPNILSVILNGDELCPSGVVKDIWNNYTNVIHQRLGSENFGIQECGRRHVDHVKLITNGLNTKRGDWPWHVAVKRVGVDGNSQTYICGGTLINPTSIITAAHCVYYKGEKLNPERLFVSLGMYSLYGGGSNQEKSVKEIIVYTDFEPQTLRHDIAILKLDLGVIYNQLVQPICLWKRDKTEKSHIVNQDGIIVGWGFTENSELSNMLLQGTMPVVSDFTCLQSNPTHFERYLKTNETYCAGFRNGTSACNGDSGGGMYFSANEEGSDVWFLRGIVSLSVMKRNELVCDPKQYILFTDTASYLDWIENNIK